MTEIVKMIREEGVKEGKAEGKSEILIIKFKSVSEEYKEKIRKLPEETIDVISTDIFDLEDIKDVDKYF